MRREAFCALIMTSVFSAPALAATGDVLVEYAASSGMLPSELGWEVEAECLRNQCPGTMVDSAPGGQAGPCYWQGAQDFGEDGFPDNVCISGTGCHHTDEHYNAPFSLPSGALGVNGSCSYTEWMVFDDGDNTSGRPLTIPDAELDDQTGAPVGTVRVVDAPPFGAINWPGARTNHPPLRLSIGSGDDEGRVLPAVASNNRNGGKIKVRSRDLFTIPPGVDSVTVVARLAFGPWALNTQHSVIEMRMPSTVPDRHWRFGITPPNSVPAHAGEKAIGVSNRKEGGNHDPLAYPYDNLNLREYSTNTETWDGGEFYTLRIVFRSDGTYTTYWDELASSAHSAGIGTPGVNDGNDEETELHWGINDRSGGASCTVGCGKTVWFDFITVLEGDVPPTGCYMPVNDPVYDTEGDGDVDLDDFDNVADMDFRYCWTGPALGANVWESRPMWCRCMDSNGDSSIDMIDFAAFQRCAGLYGASLEACDD